MLRFPNAWRLLVVAVAYYVGARLGLRLALFNSQVTPFWPPTGVAIAAMLLWGRGVWPAVLVAAYAINLPLGNDLHTPALIAVGNVSAPLLAISVLRRLGFRSDVARLRDAGALVLAGTTSMLVSAGVGTLSLVLDGLPLAAARSVAITWWTGDTVGALLVTPFLLTLCHLPTRPRPRRLAEATVLLGLTVLTTYVGFASANGMRFLVFPVLAAAAVRFGLRGAAPLALVSSLLATYTASQGAGGFASVSTTEAMAVLSLFNACVTFTTYLLSAMTSDRRLSLDALERQGGELEQLVLARTQELRGALDLLGEAQQIARLGTWECDVLTGQATWSAELYTLTQRAPGSPMDVDTYLDLCHPTEVTQFRATMAHTVATGEPFTVDHRLRKGDGTYRWLHCQGQVVRNGAGAVVGTRGTAIDIDERKRAEQRFAQLVEMAPDAMVFVNDKGVITQINRQTEVLFGYDRQELVGQRLELLVPERLHDKHVGHRAGFAHHPDRRPMGRDSSLLARRKGGIEFPVEISLSPLETDQGQLVSASIRDVTERRHQQEELSYRSLHDTLTGLPNRALLADRLQHALEAMGRAPGRLTGVFFLDLDRFKWVNDSLGHDAGDQLLRAVTERLTQTLRPKDTVARFGGDEFVVVGVEIADAAEADEIAQRLRNAVAVPVSLPGGHVVVPTVSVGLVTTADARTDPADLLRDADAAMYRAKELGRDRTASHEPGNQAQIGARLTTAGELRSAIAHGELVVHYQPVVSLGTGETSAVEALVRWNHPQRGLLMPAEFIELAEETGQIAALDRAVILTACREFGTYVASEPLARDLSLNVNVSLRNLSMPHLAEALEAGLAAGALEPHQLTVEVTESADLSSEKFSDLLAMVRGLGAKVAVDDFGTGFSALSRLNGLGIDSIKVDRSFVVDVHTSTRARAIVSAMVRLATALDAAVVAEGIELPEQHQVLADLGCLSGQGFLWSPGLPLEQLRPWLAARALIVPTFG